MTWSLPNKLSILRNQDSYEQILSRGSRLPMILYDTSDRRAWMVPWIGVILHMVHVWLSLQKENFPSLELLQRPPYVIADWDIGRVAQQIIHENSDQELYTSKDDHKPVMLKHLVKRYWLEIESLTAANSDHRVTDNGNLIGWELLEVINHDPLSSPKKPSTKKFQGNWLGLTGNPMMIVLLGHGLGDIVKPRLGLQEPCRRWRSVPTGNDYLTATNNCVVECSKQFFNSMVFWECKGDRSPCADCLDKPGGPCQRVSKLKKRHDKSIAACDLEPKGAMVFGHQN